MMFDVLLITGYVIAGAVALVVISEVIANVWVLYQLRRGPRPPAGWDSHEGC